MKKILAMFLVACFILCLSACDNKENSSDLSNDNFQTSSTETQTNTSDETSGPGETKEPSSLDGSSNTDNSNNANSSNGSGNSNNTNGSNGSGASNNSNGTNGTNNSTTPTHTHKFSNATCTEPAKCSCGATNGNSLGHSYSNADCTNPKKCSLCGATNGSALGHKWQDATCKAPKTCSVCRKTEGSIGTHVIENGLCKFCAKTIVVSPKNLDTSKTYLCVIERGDVNVLGTPLTDSVEVLYLGFLSSSHGAFSNVGYFSPINIHNDDACEYIFYKDKKYFWYLPLGGFVCDITYEFTDEEIIMRDTYEPQIYAKLNVLSDGSIKVVSKTDDFKSDLKVGMIFKPMAINNFN